MCPAGGCTNLLVRTSFAGKDTNTGGGTILFTISMCRQSGIECASTEEISKMVASGSFIIVLNGRRHRAGVHVSPEQGECAFRCRPAIRLAVSGRELRGWQRCPERRVLGHSARTVGRAVRSTFGGKVNTQYHFSP